jgi:malonyl-CoA decarboxylase
LPIEGALNVSFLQEILNSVAERGRNLLPRALVGAAPEQELEELALALVSVRGEASGVALAREVLAKYRALDMGAKRVFFSVLAHRLGPDIEGIRQAAEAYAQDSSDFNLKLLMHVIEPPRQEFFRRLNLAPGATAEIVRLRHDLLGAVDTDAGLQSVDDDLVHLLSSWFNRGFLSLRRIDWSTPANILEKIIAYEAVHEIQGWDDLRRRLDPADRRCYAFFHPSLVDEPLIFVEVALQRAIPGSIQELLLEERKPGADSALPTTAVFYSISNCQEGLRGISFGNFLIKQVAEELARELPSLKAFVTLSPVPGFADWLGSEAAREAISALEESERIALQLLEDPAWVDEPETAEELHAPLLSLAAHYFLAARTKKGRPVDPVARFHLGNGARLERINWKGDVSDKGLQQAHGLMVNYLYELKSIERNHEAFANQGLVAASRAVRSLLRTPEKPAEAEASMGWLAQATGAVLPRSEPPKQLAAPAPAVAKAPRQGGKRSTRT